MPTYILMTRLGADALRDPRGRKTVGAEWKLRVEKLCPEVKWIAHYALLGRYDFMDIYEAPSDEVAHKVSLLSRETGALTAESWPAVPYEHFLGLAKEIERGLRSGA